MFLHVYADSVDIPFVGIVHRPKEISPSDWLNLFEQSAEQAFNAGVYAGAFGPEGESLQHAVKTVIAELTNELLETIDESEPERLKSELRKTLNRFVPACLVKFNPERVFRLLTNSSNRFNF